jgi:hypothetical protein
MKEHGSIPGTRGKKHLGEIVQVIQAIATIVAIIVGGVWTYRLFVLQRLAYPHLKIDHSVTDLPLPENQMRLVVDIIHTNSGSIKITPQYGFLKIYRLQDLPAETADQLNEPQPQDGEDNDGTWEILDNHAWKWDPRTPLIIEPGESNQLHYELTLDADVGPLEIYSYFRNPTITDQDLGWRHTSIYLPAHARESAGAGSKPKGSRAPLLRRPSKSRSN